RIPEVRAGGISRLRNGDAVIKRQAVKSAIRVHAPRSELGEQPPIHKLVVQHDWITGGVGAILDRKAGPERTSVYRSHQQVARLVIHAKDEIDDLDVIVGSNFAVWIRRVHPEAENVEVI